jgi:hypothetical protein
MNTALERGTIDHVSEKNRKIIKGMGIAMVHAKTGEIWVNRELRTKPVTGKEAGQWTIPFETQKPDEPPESNMQGGLVEIFNDYDHQGNPVMPTLAEQLFTVDKGHFPRLIFKNGGGNNIDFGMAVLLYDGPKALDVTPLDNQEVAHVGWKPVDVFLASPNVRPLARFAVEEMVRTDALEIARDTYHNNPELREPVVHTDFSLQDFYNKREQRLDVEPVEVYNAG